MKKSCLICWKRLRKAFGAIKVSLEYLNARDSQNKTIINLDKPRAKIIKQIFDKFSRETYKIEKIKKN